MYTWECVCFCDFYLNVFSHITLLSLIFCCFVSFLLTSNLHLHSLFLPARDLDKLREEFWHQQMKIDEMNFLKQSLDAEGMLCGVCFLLLLRFCFCFLFLCVCCLIWLVKYVDFSPLSRDNSVVRALDLVIERLQVRIPAGAAGEFSSLGSTFWADSYFGIHFTPMLPRWLIKDPSHSAKSAGGRLQLNMHAPYVCGFAWSDMVLVWCTQNAPRWQPFHVAPAMPAL